MTKSVFKIYREPLAISFVLIILILAATVERTFEGILQVSVGALLGTFLLDLDYVLYAYVFDPEKDFSKTLRGYIKHGDLKNVLLFIYNHKDEVEDKTLNSALFQLVLAVLTVVVVFTSTNLMTKTLVVSAFTNTIYQMVELKYLGNIKSWFWAIDMKVNDTSFYIYLVVMLSILGFIITSF